jgi:hypothetical protein
MVVLSFTIWFNLWQNPKFYNTGLNCVEILSNAEFSFPKLLHFFLGSRLDTNRNSFLTTVIHIFDLPFYQLTKDDYAIFYFVKHLLCRVELQLASLLPNFLRISVSQLHFMKIAASFNWKLKLLVFHFETAVAFSSFSHRANRWRVCPFHACVCGRLNSNFMCNF